MTLLRRAARLAVCLSLGAVLVPIANGDDLGFHAGAVTAQAIDGYLSTKKYKGKTSPLVGSGSAFVSAGQAFDIDPALVAAISGIETSFALRTCTTDNAWNWFWQGPCPNSPFTSYTDGIQTVSKHLRLSYINKGYNSIALIQKRYCTAPVTNGVVCPGWISTVTLFRDQIAGLAPPPPPPPPGSGTGDTDASTGAVSSTVSTSSTSKYWWIAGGGIVLAAALGWLLGRKRSIG